MIDDYLPRVATVPFRLGRPEELPVEPSAFGADRVLDEVARVLIQPRYRLDLGTLLDGIRTARTVLSSALVCVPLDVDESETPANRDNDVTFGIHRVSGEPLRLLADSALAALDGVVALAHVRGIGFPATSWTELITGFDTVFAWLAHPARRADAPRVPVPPPVDEVCPEDVLRRWVRGHHVFMVLAQSCGLALAVLRAHHQRGDLAGAASCGEAATTFMWASRGALRYAGDAGSDDYVAEIRPTLMPPIAPPKMSGLHWRDHEYLVRQLRRSEPAWRWLGQHEPDRLREFRDALAEVYSAHRDICQLFVGDSAPSLLAKAGSRSATAVLAQFRELRLGLLPPAPD
jgi:hypothetical protein